MRASSSSGTSASRGSSSMCDLKVQEGQQQGGTAAQWLQRRAAAAVAAAMAAGGGGEWCTGMTSPAATRSERLGVLTSHAAFCT